ncbi:uncharacterized protein EV420DRAFT_1642307 [Desarmillaria tabescens]|uniref:Uncharacterized protein n=1 Tax=Armillaria tabescens TaxID=1929756 RepID=A0AA39KEK0_ARMTA|nr:uncharacterized protein EV420DRAFT_1642307 [Desarmillaria tabescens]KAK0459338.1 hypothetical protein EV420DRAFT_1642307 [Desarmillaria tabescens]
MHLALGIFFVGLVIFLVPLRSGLSWVIGIGTVAAYATYLITIFLPILYPQCPYRIPLSDLVYFPYRYITQDLFPKHIRPLFVEEKDDESVFYELEGKGISSLDDLERGVVQERSGILSAEALHWLFSSSSNPTVHSIVVQSIGGLPLSAKDTVKKVFGGRDRHVQPKPRPGMEPKVERLLRFELFIPNWLHMGRNRLYVDIADGDLELAAAVQSNDAVQKSQYKPFNTPTPAAFFEQVTCSSQMNLPPVVWLKLMQMAKDDGAFAPIDVDSLDSFPMDLCSRVVPCIMNTFKDASPCFYFENAAPDYFNDESTANLLNMISAFDILTDKISFPSTFKLMLAFVRYLLHRVSLSSFDVDIQRAISATHFVLHNYVSKNLPDEQIAALANLVEDVVHSPVFKPGSEWTVDPQDNFWPALQPLVETMINQYDALYDADHLRRAPFDTMCKILGFGLRHGVETVYDIFLDMRCLDVFGSHSLRPLLVTVINGYIAGLAALDTPIDVQRHLDYLHKPENLFLVCCILITNGWNACGELPDNVFSPPLRLSEDICTDIGALASLRPSDPSWDQCRRKLRDLLQDDGGEFFVKQQK